MVDATGNCGNFRLTAGLKTRGRDERHLRNYLRRRRVSLSIAGLFHDTFFQPLELQPF